MAETVDATPVYMRIRRRIEECIERGIYPTGSMIPSENELAEEFGTTRLTIRSAVDELVRAASRPSASSRVPSVMRVHIMPTCLALPRTTCSIPFDV